MHRKKHSTIRSFERALRVQELIGAGVVQSAAEIPAEAIPASLEVIAQWRSSVRLCGRAPYYLDIRFTCEDCGETSVWSAQDQRHWYEVAGGSPYSEPRRCADCRRKRKGRSNQAVQRTGASRFAQGQIPRHRRLAPVADLIVSRQ
jgi:hypothetical protein